MVEHYLHGLDEAGKIGDKLVFVSSVIHEDNEISLMLKNLNYFNKLILNKRDVNGFEQKQLIKYISDMIDDDSITIKIHYMENQIQNILLGNLFKILSNKLYKMRGNLVRYFEDKDVAHVEYAVKELTAFKRRAIYAESYVKSYAFFDIVKKIGKSYLRRYETSEKLLSDGPIIDIQIDGGFPFSYWLFDLLDDSESGFVRTKSYISGITNGDSSFPIISLSGTIAQIFNKYPEKLPLFSATEVDFPNWTDMQFTENFNKHYSSLANRRFRNRLLLVGDFDDELKRLIPYALYLESGRTQACETYSIKYDLRSFIHEYSYGHPDNTKIVIGNCTTREDRENAQYCKELQYQNLDISDLKEPFSKMFDSLESEINILPMEKRTKLSSNLVRIKTPCLGFLQ